MDVFARTWLSPPVEGPFLIEELGCGVWPATRNKQQQTDDRQRLTIVLWAAMPGHED